MPYLLDTNILSDLIKYPVGKAAQQVRRLPSDALYTSVIVAGELYYGGRKKKSVVLQQRIATLLTVIPVLPLDSTCIPIYGQIRCDLESKGTPIGAND